jgi:putative tryptophan/tyrosine transport system substrate-binding protein
MQFGPLQRREFVTLLGGAVAAWPLAASAQQRERMRSIGVLMNRAADNPEGQDRLAAFQQGLQEAGWSVGRNVRIDTRWSEDNADLSAKYAAELVALAPDIILASGTLAVMALQHINRTLPIVFASVADPVGAGIVDSLAHPGGNATGFMIYEYSLGAKWLEFLKQIAPSVTRVAVVRNAANPAGIAQFSTIQNAAQSLGVEVSPVNVRAPDQIERDIAAFARSPNGGLIVMQSASATIYRALIIAVVARYKLPAVYGLRYDVAGGGLISYGADIVEQFRQAATYVDRILKGKNPADLPVQAPTKYQLIINLKTAKALGLTVPDKLLGIADEVIE